MIVYRITHSVSEECQYFALKIQAERATRSTTPPSSQWNIEKIVVHNRQTLANELNSAMGYGER